MWTYLISIYISLCEAAMWMSLNIKHISLYTHYSVMFKSQNSWMYLLNNTLLGEHVADRVHSNSNYNAAIRWILESHSKLNNIVSPVTSLKCYKQNTTFLNIDGIMNRIWSVHFWLIFQLQCYRNYNSICINCFYYHQ